MRPKPRELRRVARIYRSIWYVAVGGLCALGAAAGWWLLGLAAIATLTIAAGAIGGWTYWVVVHVPQQTSIRVQWSSMADATMRVVCLSLAVAGLGRLTGASGPLLLGLILLASPDTPGLLRRLQGRATGAGQDLEPPDVGSLSTEDLCCAWSASFDAVTITHDPRRLQVLSGLRRDYLDELERRDPGGFDAWLALHARPGDDPRPHLSLEPGPSRFLDT